MKFVHVNTQERGFGLIFDNEPENIYTFAVETKGIPDISLTYANLFGWLMSSDDDKIRGSIRGDKVPDKLGEVPLGAAIPRPIHDIICVGLNYKDHVEECHKNDIKTLDLETPTFFSKRASRVFGNGDLPFDFHVDDKLDYEVELAVIIGKAGKNIPEDKVQDHIFGYAVFNDFSARTVQKATSQWYRGKSMDGLSAMSDQIVLAKNLEFPPNFPIRSYVNGELRQESTTNNVIHDLGKLISTFSQGTMLEAGDIIITGTPAGVAMGMDKPQYLKAGDVVRCEIDGVGTLENKIVQWTK